MKALADPQHSFPGQGQMKPEQLEIAQLKRARSSYQAQQRALVFGVVGALAFKVMTRGARRGLHLALSDFGDNGMPLRQTE